MIRISQIHLSAALAASKDESRPVLTALYLRHEAGKTIAVSTDSYQLYEVTKPIHEDDRETDETNAGYLLPAHVVKTMIQSFQAVNKMIKLDAHTIEIDATSYTTAFGKNEYTQIDGQFPKYAAIMETKREPSSVNLNPRYLGMLAKFMVNNVGSTMETCGKLGPIMFEANSNGEDYEKRAMIMPLRI